MPGGVPRTSTLALTNATFPYALQLANKGWKRALADQPALLHGLNIVEGHVTYPGVAEAFGMPFEEPRKFILGNSGVRTFQTFLLIVLGGRASLPLAPLIDHAGDVP